MEAHSTLQGPPPSPKPTSPDVWKGELNTPWATGPLHSLCLEPERPVSASCVLCPGPSRVEVHPQPVSQPPQPYPSSTAQPALLRLLTRWLMGKSRVSPATVPWPTPASSGYLCPFPPAGLWLMTRGEPGIHERLWMERMTGWLLQKPKKRKLPPHDTTTCLLCRGWKLAARPLTHCGSLRTPGTHRRRVWGPVGGEQG